MRLFDGSLQLLRTARLNIINNHEKLSHTMLSLVKSADPCFFPWKGKTNRSCRNVLHRRLQLIGSMMGAFALVERLPTIQSFGSVDRTRYFIRPFHSTTICRLNRFLFDSCELDPSGGDPGEMVSTVTLPKDDYRTIHAAKILGLHNGDAVRAGLVSCNEHDGLSTDQAIIQWIPEGKVKKAEPLKNGNPPGSIQFRLNSLTPQSSYQKPRVSLILALPRPLQLGRMLPMIAQMGVDCLVLTEARKVSKDYFGSHLFRRPDELRLRLVEGLCQSGDVKLPNVYVIRNLGSFLENDLGNLFPSAEFARAIAHPQREGQPLCPRVSAVEFPKKSTCRRMVVAVGPEGGWEEPDEIERFQQYGFEQVTLGRRTLRSDVAVISLLSLAQDACS